MKLVPQNDWAVVRPAAAEKKTAGGIILPDNAAERPQEGVVEAIGPGAYEDEKADEKDKKEKKERKFVPTTVKPGQRVVFQKYSGQSFNLGGEEVILVRERDILGIVSGS